MIKIPQINHATMFVMHLACDYSIPVTLIVILIVLMLMFIFFHVDFLAPEGKLSFIKPIFHTVETRKDGYGLESEKQGDQPEN